MLFRSVAEVEVEAREEDERWVRKSGWSEESPGEVESLILLERKR